LWHGDILQRPLFIDEFNVDATDSVSARASRPHGCMDGKVVLLTCEANEASNRNLQRRKQRCPTATNVLRYALFAFGKLSFFVPSFKEHINGNVVTRMNTLI